MIHLYVFSSSKVWVFVSGCEIFALDKGVWLEGQVGAKILARSLLVGSCAFIGGHISSEGKAAICNLYKSSLCFLKAVCPCFWWMSKCILFRWAALLTYWNVVIQREELHLFNSFFIIPSKIQEANTLGKTQTEFCMCMQGERVISPFLDHSFNFFYYLYYSYYYFLLLHLRVVKETMDLNSGNLKSEPQYSSI